MTVAVVTSSVIKKIRRNQLGDACSSNQGIGKKREGMK